MNLTDDGMEIGEMDELCISILKTLCEKLEFNIAKTFMGENPIYELFPNVDRKVLRGKLLYLGKKDFLNFQKRRFMGDEIPYDFKLTTKTIDMVNNL